MLQVMCHLPEEPAEREEQAELEEAEPEETGARAAERRPAW